MQSKIFVGIDDIETLEQSKQQIKNRLDSIDQKFDTISNVLNRKLAKKIHNLKPEELALTKSNIPVSSFVNPPNPVKSLPKLVKQRNDFEISPKILKSSKIIELRKDHLINKESQLVKKIQEEKLKSKQEGQRKLQLFSNQQSYNKSKILESFFPNRYVRGELPCTIEHGPNGVYLSWMCPIEHLDYSYYLPVFFDGLQCKENPYKLMATHGVEDLIYAARKYPEKLIKNMKKLVLPIRNAFLTNDHEIILNVLKILQSMIKDIPNLGKEILRYSSQVLVPLRPYFSNTRNIGDQIDYRQRKYDDIGEEVRCRDSRDIQVIMNVK